MLKDALAYVRDAGLIGACLVAIIGGWRRWWVWGWQYDECCQRATRAEEALERARHVWSDAERASHRRKQIHHRGEERT